MDAKQFAKSVKLLRGAFGAANVRAREDFRGHPAVELLIRDRLFDENPRLRARISNEIRESGLVEPSAADEYRGESRYARDVWGDNESRPSELVHVWVALSPTPAAAGGRRGRARAGVVMPAGITPAVVPAVVPAVPAVPAALNRAPDTRFGVEFHTKPKRVRKPKRDDGAVRSYRSRKVRKELPPNTFFACDHPRVGTQIPGKPPRGGLVTGCVTPSVAHPSELQFQVGLPGLGAVVRSSTVKHRYRDGLVHDLTGEQKIAVAQAVTEYRTSGVPYPVGRVHPGRAGKSKCDPENPLWLDYSVTLDQAFERAAGYCASHRCDASTESELVREVVLAAPLGAEWLATSDSCAANYERTIPRAGSWTDAKQMAAWKREYLDDPDNDQDARISSREFRDFIRDRGWDDSAYRKKEKARKARKK